MTGCWVVTQGLSALDMEHFFTVGHDEVRAWGIRRGTKAPQVSAVDPKVPHVSAVDLPVAAFPASTTPTVYESRLLL